jgi:hypothetical protein
MLLTCLLRRPASMFGPPRNKYPVTVTVTVTQLANYCSLQQRALECGTSLEPMMGWNEKDHWPWNTRANASVTQDSLWVFLMVYSVSRG